LLGRCRVQVRWTFVEMCRCGRGCVLNVQASELLIIRLNLERVLHIQWHTFASTLVHLMELVHSICPLLWLASSSIEYLNLLTNIVRFSFFVHICSERPGNCCHFPLSRYQKCTARIQRERGIKRRRKKCTIYYLRKSSRICHPIR
jgi:hypothetical protein